MNAYRVLLTRGRDAAVVFVPPDRRLDATAAWLQAHGVKVLGEPLSELVEAPPRKTDGPPEPPSAAPPSPPKAVPGEKSEHVLDGVTYVWTGATWHDKKTYLRPRPSVLDRLDRLVALPEKPVPEKPVPKPRPSRGVTYATIGAVPDVAVGTVFANRRELQEAGIHRPLQAGICGSEKTGAESIVLNGGYEDDVDAMDEIVYTGHGGNDPGSGRQVADQTLTRSNLALARSCEWGQPVRVVRGWREPGGLGPKSGYRYDGLYRVTRYWEERGRSGFKIWRFALVPFEPADE